MTQNANLVRFGLFTAALLAASGCAGGQSGTEGERPAAPCARNGTLLTAHVNQLAGECVGVEVDRVVTEGDEIARPDGTIVFDGAAEPGETLRGRLGSVYAYTHEFRLNDSVAVLVEPFEDSLLLQLIPMDDEHLQVQWAGRHLVASLDELAAADCDAQLNAKFEAATPPRTASHGSSTPQATEPAPSAACTP